MYFFFQSQALQGIFNGCNSLSKIWIVTNQEVSLQTQIDTKNQTQQSSQLNGKKENFSLSQWELKVTRQCSSAGKRMWSSDNSFPLCVLLVEEVVGNFLTNQGALWSKKKNGLALEIQLKCSIIHWHLLVILFTTCHTILMMLLWWIWYWINWYSPNWCFFYSHHLSAWYITCIIDQTWGQDGWTLAKFFFGIFMDQ